MTIVSVTQIIQVGRLPIDPDQRAIVMARFGQVNRDPTAPLVIAYFRPNSSPLSHDAVVVYPDELSAALARHVYNETESGLQGHKICVRTPNVTVLQSQEIQAQLADYRISIEFEPARAGRLERGRPNKVAKHAYSILMDIGTQIKAFEDDIHKDLLPEIGDMESAIIEWSKEVEDEQKVEKIV